MFQDLKLYTRQQPQRKENTFVAQSRRRHRPISPIPFIKFVHSTVQIQYRQYSTDRVQYRLLPGRGGHIEEGGPLQQHRPVRRQPGK